MAPHAVVALAGAEAALPYSSQLLIAAAQHTSNCLNHDFALSSCSCKGSGNANLLLVDQLTSPSVPGCGINVNFSTTQNKNIT